MYLTLHNDDGSRNRYRIDREAFADDALKNRIGYIHSSSKEQTALEIFKAYFSNAKAILLDSSNQILLEKLKTLNVGEFSNPYQGRNPFEDEDFLMMFFTSGSTGMPVGALKTRENLEAEVKSLSKLFSQYEINKVVVTVPFLHIYGLLLGLLYPLHHGIDVVLKEHFLPHDLLEEIDTHCLVVTTPLYIKALAKLGESKNLKQSLFVSSTAPLDEKTAEQFIDRYDTHLVQLFGSTETGGIAYKMDLDKLWTPMSGVKIATNEKNELLVTSPFVSRVLYEGEMRHLDGPFETFDYVEMEEAGFRLLGRSSKILKMAGKRYSTVQIESVLEETEGIQKALVFVSPAPHSLRGELLDITIESDRLFSVREIRQIIRRHFSTLNFAIDLKRVPSIPLTQTGKKMRIR
jgi:acyl-coenzyme A synthetase/AMP-(fatty) acid ligase